MPGDSSRRGRRDRRDQGFSRETNLRRRPAGTRQERRTVLILTNGARTEVDYLDAIRKEQWVTAQKVKVKFEKGDPTTVVICAAKIRDDDAYDEAWVVCDVDEYDVKPAMNHAYDRKVRLALSVPSFEVWLILHHKNGCRGFDNATQAGKFLKRILPDWDKTELKFSDFREHVFDAVKRAKSLGEPPDANPSTAVWQLVESLRANH